MVLEMISPPADVMLQGRGSLFVVFHETTDHLFRGERGRRGLVPACGTDCHGRKEPSHDSHFFVASIPPADGNHGSPWIVSFSHCGLGGGRRTQFAPPAYEAGGVFLPWRLRMAPWACNALRGVTHLRGVSAEFGGWVR